MPQKSNPDKRHSSRLNVRRKGRNLKGRRYTLSIDAQAVLSNLLGDVIEKTLENAKKMAEDEGKNQVSIEDIEKALKKLCKSFHSIPTSNTKIMLNSGDFVF